jgi:Trypsin
MKVFVVILLFVASVASTPFIQSRIASGVLAKDGQAKCYATIVISGEFGGAKQCGACLLQPENRILTAASCVFSAGEGKASGIKVYPGIKLPKEGDEVKGVDVVEIFAAIDYDANKNTSLGDIAVVMLADRMKTTTGKFEATFPMLEDRADNFVGQRLTVCGMGSTDNYRAKPKGLMCTTLRVVPSAECMKALPPGPTTTAAATTSARRKKR